MVQFHVCQNQTLEITGSLHINEKSILFNEGTLKLGTETLIHTKGVLISTGNIINNGEIKKTDSITDRGYYNYKITESDLY